MAKKRKGVPTSDTSALTSNPFAALAPTASPTATEDDAGAPVEPAVPSRAIVRYQRKGRGGKEVTLVELRGAAEIQLDAWVAELKRELGCGGFVEEQCLVLSGDQRQRLRGLLENRGVAKITVS